MKKFEKKRLAINQFCYDFFSPLFIDRIDILFFYSEEDRQFHLAIELSLKDNSQSPEQDKSPADDSDDCFMADESRATIVSENRGSPSEEKQEGATCGQMIPPHQMEEGEMVCAMAVRRKSQRVTARGAADEEEDNEPVWRKRVSHDTVPPGGDDTELKVLGNQPEETPQPRQQQQAEVHADSARLPRGVSDPLYSTVVNRVPNKSVEDLAFEQTYEEQGDTSPDAEVMGAYGGVPDILQSASVPAHNKPAPLSSAQYHLAKDMTPAAPASPKMNPFGFIKDLSVTNVYSSDLDKTQDFDKKDLSSLFRSLLGDTPYETVFEPRPNFEEKDDNRDIHSLSVSHRDISPYTSDTQIPQESSHPQDHTEIVHPEVDLQVTDIDDEDECYPMIQNNKNNRKRNISSVHSPVELDITDNLCTSQYITGTASLDAALMDLTALTRSMNFDGFTDNRQQLTAGSRVEYEMRSMPHGGLEEEEEKDNIRTARLAVAEDSTLTLNEDEDEENDENAVFVWSGCFRLIGPCSSERAFLFWQIVVICNCLLFLLW